MPSVFFTNREPIYVKEIVGGNGFTYFLKNNGGIWNCGYNDYGQLGRVISSSNETTVNLGQLIISGVKKIVGGNGFTYVLKNNGEVWNWGQNNQGKLGRVTPHGSSNAPNVGQLVIQDVKEIVGSALSAFTYFLKTNGEVWNCGDNNYGQLGRVVNTGSESVVNLGQLNISDVKEIVCSQQFTYFLKNNGEVWNCGYNVYGQLGRVVDSGSQIVVNLGQLVISDVKEIICGGSSTYFLKTNGEVWNCGQNGNGQLGRISVNGGIISSNLGQLNISDVKEISCGQDSTYFLKNNGEVWNCGANNYGQLGRVVNTGSTSVVNLGQLSISDVKEIVCGGSSIYFLKTNGEVWNCGLNNYGQLGRVVSSGSQSVVNLGQLNI